MPAPGGRGVGLTLSPANDGPAKPTVRTGRTNKPAPPGRQARPRVRAYARSQAGGCPRPAPEGEKKNPTQRGGKRDRAPEFIRGAKRADARARRLRAKKQTRPTRGGKRDRASELMRGAKRADARARRLRAKNIKTLSPRGRGYSYIESSSHFSGGFDCRSAELRVWCGYPTALSRRNIAATSAFLEIMSA
jgi:hypothetical protein